jgi:hypothetical protein
VSALSLSHQLCLAAIAVTVAVIGLVSVQSLADILSSACTTGSCPPLAGHLFILRFLVLVAALGTAVIQYRIWTSPTEAKQR